MVEFVWEFVVKEENQGQFELAYGPGGAWSKIFARSHGFRGTTVLRDVEKPQRYLTIDLWDTVTQRAQALDEHKTEITALETAFAGWTESRTLLGIFRVRVEATVRPRGRPGRSSRRTAR